MSEPEVDALVRAIGSRPNICGYNAYHTAGKHSTLLCDLIILQHFSIDVLH